VTLEEAERSHILHTLQETNGVVSGRNGAAVRLGLPRTTLISKMQRLGINRVRKELALAKAGYDVFAGVRSLSAGEPLVKAPSSLPGKITPILLDVTDDAQVDAAAQVKASRGGEPMFGLVNNAGNAHGGLLLHPADRPDSPGDGCQCHRR